MTYTLESIEADRKAGLSWRDIAGKHGVSWQRIRGFYSAEKLKTATEAETASAASGDPFEDAPRDKADPESMGDASSSSSSSSSSASALGMETAEQVLPMLFSVADAFASAGAVWIIRRKLGPLVTQELIEQAQGLAALTEPQRAALSAVLVSRIAAIELTPDEALLLTVAGIYAGKALAVMQLGPTASPMPATFSVVSSKEPEATAEASGA